jgi:hypothetical protein
LEQALISDSVTYSFGNLLVLWSSWGDDRNGFTAAVWA